MRVWEERVRKEIKAAPEISLSLRNSFPEYLTKLAEALSEGGERHKSSLARGLKTPDVPGTKHGRDRAARPSYTIDQLISEYHILRQTIFSVMEAEVELSSQERETIINSIEQTVNDAATEFSEYLKAVQENLSNTLIHDLRTPLAAAVLLVEMIESSPANLAHNRNIETQISSNLERVQSMLCRLLDYSSIKAGQELSLYFEQIDLSQLVQKVADEFNFTGTNRIRVIAPSTLIGFWDERGLTSILENLAANALKYSAPDTPIEITVKDQNRMVQIVVHNIGKPIPLVDQSKLFERFQRGHLLKDTPGWGLGLSIVKSIVESHGGHVSVESLENLGTSFIVDLPIDCTQNQALSPPELTSP